MATALEAVSKAEHHLQTALFGLEDMHRPDRLVSGLHNAVVFGRATTFALQNMSGSVAGFDAWWEQKRREMQADPLMQCFKELRNRIEKDASSNVGVQVRASFNEEFWKRVLPAPPGATGIAGEIGGRTWWNVALPDGTVERYYVAVPESFESISSVILTFPEEFRNQPADALVAKYLDYLARAIGEARKLFVDKATI
jgi:hypothetical protein